MVPPGKKIRIEKSQQAGMTFLKWPLETALYARKRVFFGFSLLSFFIFFQGAWIFVGSCCRDKQGANPQISHGPWLFSESLPTSGQNNSLQQDFHKPIQHSTVVGLAATALGEGQFPQIASPSQELGKESPCKLHWQPSLHLGGSHWS